MKLRLALPSLKMGLHPVQSLFEGERAGGAGGVLLFTFSPFLFYRCIGRDVSKELL